MKLAPIVSAVAVVAAGLVPVVLLQEDKALTAPELRTMLTNLGYTVKDLNTESGKEKFEFAMTTTDLNVPVGAEISPSARYVWFTVNLGDAPQTGFETKALALLKQNGKIQPSFFYLTSKNRIMMAVAVDNRNLTPAVVKFRIEKLVKDVGETKPDWSQ